MTGLSLRGLTVRRGRTTVLHDVSCSAPAGAVTALLGPAGAGKTTLLASVAGLLPPERGAILLNGQDITRTRAARRGIGLLAPGSSLGDTGTVSAAWRGLAGRGGRGLSDAAIIALGLEGLGPRQVTSLTHGEALAALAVARLARAGALLVDEAGLGLDLATRARLQAALQARAADTVLIATRDTAVAMQADHLVLLAAGAILQAGTPASVYAEPRDAVCATMTGHANILSGHVRELRPGGFLWSGGGRYLQATSLDLKRPVLGSPVSLCLRPEQVRLLTPGEAADNAVTGIVTALRTSGPMLEIVVAAPFGPLMAMPPGSQMPRPGVGQTVTLGWSMDAAWNLDAA